jgi:uncharacterized protein (TIGR03067 family)
MTAEIRKLQGTWSVETLEVDGRPMSRDMLSGAKIVIQGDRFTSLSMGAVYEGSLRVDVSKTPSTIDMLFESGPEKGNTSLGIYQLDGSNWKLCLTVTGKTRPSSFRTAPGGGLAFETLKRERPATKKGAAAREARKTSEPEKQSAGSEPIPELEGEWSMVSCVRNGEPLEPSMIACGRRLTLGDQTTMYFGPQVFMKAKVQVDRSVTPNAFDYLNLAGESKGKTQLGLFARNGKLLKMATAVPGGARPSDFSPGLGRTITEWKLIDD